MKEIYYNLNPVHSVRVSMKIAGPIHEKFERGEITAQEYSDWILEQPDQDGYDPNDPESVKAFDSRRLKGIPEEYLNLNN